MYGDSFCAGVKGCVCVYVWYEDVYAHLYVCRHRYMQVHKNICAHVCVCICRSDSSLILLSSYSEPDVFSYKCLVGQPAGLMGQKK